MTASTTFTQQQTDLERLDALIAQTQDPIFADNLRAFRCNLAVFQQSPFISFVFLVKEQRFLFVSSNAEPITGYTADRFVQGGMLFMMSTLLPEEYIIGQQIHKRAAELLAPLPPVCKMSSHLQYEQRVRVADGSYRWSRLQLFPLMLDADGLPYAFWGLSTDVTDIKQNKQMDWQLSYIDADGRYRHHSGSLPENPKPVTMQQLSTREQQVLRLIVEGKTSKAIAQTLNISENTAKAHRKNILKKAHARNATDLVRLVMATGSAF